MTLRYCLLIIAAFSIIGCGSSKPEPPPPKIPMSITEFTGRAGVQDAEAQTVADALGSMLAETGRFTMIDRAQVAALMQERSFQQAQGQQADQTHMLVVRKFLTGTLGKLGENYVFSVRLTDVQSSKIELSVSRTFDGDIEDIIEDLLPEIVGQIMATIDGPAHR